MDKMTQKAKMLFDKERRFNSDELPKVRQMVVDVLSGRISAREAALRHHVTRYQIHKWVNLLRDEVDIAKPEPLSEAMKIKIVKQISSGELSFNQASEQYHVTKDTLKVWLRSMPGLKSVIESANVKEHDLISSKIKVETVKAVQSGALNLFQASRKLGVTRYRIRTWINEYAMFNLEGNINNQPESNMASEDNKEKELLKEIDLLKKQLEDKKLKILSLETLIDVAEEKFNIKIKKKPGSKQ